MDTATGIGEVTENGGFTVTERYNVAGQRIAAPAKGVTIERAADGKVRKTVSK